jgi:long-chain acyl-CoA synthetase
VSPEWVETALRGEPAIAQAVVFGDAQPALSAVIWSARANTPDAALQVAVDHANASLPDYARVQRWVRALGPFEAVSGFATANGRAQRGAIWQAHADMLNSTLLETS